MNGLLKNLDESFFTNRSPIILRIEGLLEKSFDAEIDPIGKILDDETENEIRNLLFENYKCGQEFKGAVKMVETIEKKLDEMPLLPPLDQDQDLDLSNQNEGSENNDLKELWETDSNRSYDFNEGLSEEESLDAKGISGEESEDLDDMVDDVWGNKKDYCDRELSNEELDEILLHNGREKIKGIGKTPVKTIIQEVHENKEKEKKRKRKRKAKESLVVKLNPKKRRKVIPIIVVSDSSDEEKEDEDGLWDDAEEHFAPLYDKFEKANKRVENQNERIRKNFQNEIERNDWSDEDEDDEDDELEGCVYEGAYVLESKLDGKYWK